MRVDDALGFPGRARGVQQHRRVAGVELDRVELVGLGLDGVLPGLVARCRPGNVGPGVLVDDYRAHVGRSLVDGVVERAFERDLSATAIEAVGGEHDAALRVFDSCRSRVDAETRENRDRDGAYFETAVQYRDDLRHHRHVERDSIALFDAAGRERVGYLVRLSVEFVVRDIPRRPVLALPETGHRVTPVVVDLRVPVEDVVREVDAPAGVPVGELRAVVAHGFTVRHRDASRLPLPDSVVVLVELDIEVVDEFVPEPVDTRLRYALDIGGRPLDEFVVVIYVVCLHECPDVCRLDSRLSRLVHYLLCVCECFTGHGLQAQM